MLWFASPCASPLSTASQGLAQPRCFPGRASTIIVCNLLQSHAGVTRKGLPCQNQGIPSLTRKFVATTSTSCFCCVSVFCARWPGRCIAGRAADSFVYHCASRLTVTAQLAAASGSAPTKQLQSWMPCCLSCLQLRKPPHGHCAAACIGFRLSGSSFAGLLPVGKSSQAASVSADSSYASASS